MKIVFTRPRTHFAPVVSCVAIPGLLSQCAQLSPRSPREHERKARPFRSGKLVCPVEDTLCIFDDGKQLLLSEVRLLYDCCHLLIFSLYRLRNGLTSWNRYTMLARHIPAMIHPGIGGWKKRLSRPATSASSTNIQKSHQNMSFIACFLSL